MANPMMASHGRGQRIGLGRLLGRAALVGVTVGGLAGQSEACHLRHHWSTEAANSASTPTEQSQQILNPTSMVPQLPPLTATAPAAAITPTAATAPAAPSSSASLTPSPVTNPPAAESIPSSTAPTDVSAWQNTGTPACTCTCPVPPPSNVPVIYPPGVPGGSPPAAPSSLQPPAAGSITTPEPSTILSAFVLIGTAAFWRRRSRPMA